MIVAMHDSASETRSSRSSINWFTSALRFTAPRERAKPCSAASVSRTISTPAKSRCFRSAGSPPHHLALQAGGTQFPSEGTIVKFANGIEIGGNKIVVMAGPCSVESREQLFAVTELIAKAGPAFFAAAPSSLAPLRIRFRGSAMRPEIAARGGRSLQDAGD